MYFLFLIAFTLFFSRRSLRYLRYLQQEQYRNDRYIDWIKESQAWDKRASCMLTCFLLIYAFIPLSLSTFYTLLSLSFFILYFLEPNPIKSGKIPLHMTKRAKQILYIHLLLGFPLILLTLIFKPIYQLIIFIATAQATPVFIALSNRILAPWENHRQNKYLHEASSLIQEYKPTIIGITGSYGKTSTKHYLARLLNTSLGPTFWPSDGVNSLMGVTRQIREHMNPLHQYAVIEMGAHYPGSIAKLCRLTPPFAAIITTIGLAHMERFTSQDTIFKAKSELAQAVCSNGILIVNGDDPLALQIAENNPKKTMATFGSDPLKHTCAFTNIQESTKGTSFSLHYNRNVYPCAIKLHGKHHVANICAAFLMAVLLGANPKIVISTLPLLSPVNQRLSIQSLNGVTYLHDAYNSNPIGFKNALELMDSIEGSRRIVLTPGFIELGSIQYDENYKIAQKVFESCDIVYQIGQTNRQAFLKAHQKAKKQPTLLTFEHRDSALEHYKNNKKCHDVVLIENDLPDLYENHESF